LPFRVGYYQFRPRFGDAAGNCRKVIGALGEVEADLVVLPELAFTGYYFRNRAELKSLAEEPDRSLVVANLVDLCRERRMHLVAGVAEKARDRYFNTSLLIGPRGVVERYRKIHLFNLEKRWFDPGDAPLRVRRVRNVRVGMMICFDWVFPEVTRALALEGMDLLCHPSNLVLDHCQRVMLSRCLENGVYAVTANRFGLDKRPHGSLRFTGRSQIVDPRGQLVGRAPAQREQLFVATIDPGLARDKMITPRNHLLRDRRPRFYTS
jgi:predicted amidohydrolase